MSSTAPTHARCLSSSVPFERHSLTGRLAAVTPRLNPFPTASPSFLSPPLCSVPRVSPSASWRRPPPSPPPSIHSLCRSPVPAPAVAFSSRRRRLLPLMLLRTLHTFSWCSCLMLPFWIFHCGCVASLLSQPCPSCAVFWAAGVHALCVVLCARCPGPPGSCSPVCTLRVWCCVYGVLGLLAPVHRGAHPVCCVACKVSWASWLLLTGVHALSVVLQMRCPRPLGCCSPACTLSVCCCVRGVLGSLAPVHRCACSGALCRVYGVLGPLAPVHRCARFACGVVCAASRASWLLFTGARARCVLLACFLSPSLIPACSCACSPCLPSCLFLPPPSRPRGALGVRIRVSVCVRPLFRPLLPLFPPGSCPPSPPSPPHLALASPFRHRVPSALVCSGPGSMCPSAAHSSPSPLASHLLLFLLPLRVSSPSCPPPSFPCSCSCSPLRVAPPPSPSPCLLPRTIPGPLRPRTFQSGCIASPDFPVRGTGCTPGRSSPGVRAALHSAPYAPIRGVFLSYSFRCLGHSSQWHQVHPWTI